MVLALILVCVASLGPALQIAGESFRIVLPWALCLQLPLIDQALPARLSMYSFLIAGIMAAIYLGDCRHHRVVRIATGCLVVLFLLPNVIFFRKFGMSRATRLRSFAMGFTGVISTEMTSF
jgi:hypothetical protein